MNQLSRSMPVNGDAASRAVDFCNLFFSNQSIPKFVFGRNIYGESIVRHANIDGFVDDFTEDKSFLGKPVITTNQIPENALVLIAAAGRPHTARAHLSGRNIRVLDYFAAIAFSGLPLKWLQFNEGAADDFQLNFERYNAVYSRLADHVSRQMFDKLLGFRVTHDITYLDGLTNREHLQYFEDFLNLENEGEVFLDIGGYDGFTSKEFIRHCPGYAAVHIFEPESQNANRCKQEFSNQHDITIHQIGLSDTKETLRFTPAGSASKISSNGGVEINVNRLDSIGIKFPTLIKMDIEGGERKALAGAKETIALFHPRLAIAVYHGPDDFWKIPELVFEIRDDYDLYFRHYTESIYESIMFFIPKR